MKDKEIINELQELKFSKLTIPFLMKKYGVSNSKARQLRFAVSMMPGGSTPQPVPSPKPKEKEHKKEKKPSGMGISEKELRLRHDNRFIISQKVKNLERDKFLTTPEFVQFCKLRTNAGYKQILEHPDFEPYHGKAGGTTYWGHPESVGKLKEEGVLT